MTSRHWQRLAYKSFLGGLLAWSGAGTILAQTGQPAPAAVPGAAQVQRNYLNKNTVDLPITMDAPARAQIQNIHLYVKEKADAPWTLHEKGTSTQDKFRFQAPHDGEFWFTMVTIDRQGRSNPPDLRNEPPGLVVVIDTQKPSVALTNLGATLEGQLIHCDVSDANLDAAHVRFFYQSGDKNFRPLEMAPDRAGVFCIPNEAVFTGMVRLVAQDLAGNQTVCEERVSQMKTRPAPAQQASFNPPVGPSVTPPVGPNVNPPSEPKNPSPLPANVRVAPELNPTDPRPIENPSKSVSMRPNGSDGPHWEGNPPSERGPIIDLNPKSAPVTPVVAKETVPAKRQIVNNTKVFLDYLIENPSHANVSRVEVWLTRDQAKTWQKLTEDEQGKSPVGVELPGDGLFGVALLVPSNRGGSVAPSPGEQPDWWIEVDTTKPTGQFTEVQVTHSKGQATVHITWAAQDRNLGDSPVDLFYAATPKGPWLPIAKGLRAEGHYEWRAPVEIGARAHLRLIARDVAGNTGIVHTHEPINLEDPSRPRVIIRNVRPDVPTPSIAPPPFQIIQPEN